MPGHAAELERDAQPSGDWRARFDAAVAGCRMLGDDRYRLLKAAAGAACRSGDGAGAARDLAAAATTVYRFAGVLARRPPTDEARALRTAARELAGDDPAAQAAVALADCGVQADAFIAELTEPETTVAETAALAERAVELARRTGDRLAESAALDALTGAHCWAGAAFDAAATARGRIDLLSSVQVSPASAYELVDALIMAADTSVAVGDLRGAERWGRQLRDLPLLAETGQIATSGLLVAEALAGNAGEVLADSERFLDAWVRSGRRRAPSLSVAAAAVAMVHGLRGDGGARAGWLAIAAELGATPERSAGFGPTFDAVVLLHHGQAVPALERLATEPDELGKRKPRPARRPSPTSAWPRSSGHRRIEARCTASTPPRERRG